MSAASRVADDVVMTEAERTARDKLAAERYNGVPMFGPTPRRFEVLAPPGSERYLQVTAPLRSAPFRVGSKMPGDKSAEAARLHLTMFGHWPTNAAGSTVSDAGAVVKAAACVVCHPERVKRSPARRVAVRSSSTTVEREEAAWMAERAAERVTVAEVAEVAEVETTTIEERETMSVPTDDERIRAYLDRLVHEPKRVYAVAYVAHVTGGAPAPEDPGAPWASKVRVKVDRLVKA